MKRSEVLKRLKTAAKNANLQYSEYELTNHTGVKIGTIKSTLGRHNEIDDVTAHKFFDQFQNALGKGWWR
jgi:hypothetical protein